METLIQYFSKFLAIAIAYLAMIECTSQPEQHMNMEVFRVVDILIKLLFTNKLIFIYFNSDLYTFS